MVHMTPEDMPAMPVEELARFLLGCAKEDPALLARSNADKPFLSQPMRWPSRRPPNGPPPIVPPPIDAPRGIPLTLRSEAADQGRQLEELVSIAVACARRAEDALEHAREVTWMARRRMSMIAAVSGGGILIAMAVVLLEHHSAVADPGSPQIARERYDAGDRRYQPPGIQLASAGTRTLDDAAPSPAPPDDAAKRPVAAGESSEPLYPARNAAPTAASSGVAATDLPARASVTTPAQSDPAQGSATAAQGSATETSPPAPVAAHVLTTADRVPTTAEPVVSPPASQARQAASAARTPAAPVFRPEEGTGVSALDPATLPALAEEGDRSAKAKARVASAPPRITPPHHVYHEYHEARVYRRREWYASPRQVVYTPPMLLGQVVANVRWGLYQIFH